MTNQEVKLSKQHTIGGAASMMLNQIPLHRSVESSAEIPDCIHKVFSVHATLHPEFEAVIFGDERLTYGELDRRSNQVAQFLLAQGIQPEDHIGVLMDRSADMIVSILGILKAGGTYLSIDVEYPAERVRFLAEDSQLKLILKQKSNTVRFPSGPPCISVDAPGSPIWRYNSDPVGNRTAPESIAVLSYTSGSTGQPKAARIPHRAIMRSVCSTNYIEITPVDRIAQTGSPSFDAAILEIWLALGNGAALVGIRKDVLLNLAALPGVLRKEKISVLILNTSYVHQIGRDAPQAIKGVRKVLFGGEAAEPKPLQALLRELGPGVLLNTYGPAEGCVITSFYEVNDIPDGAATVPIGKPVTNTQIYLLDSLLCPVPAGAPGEIFIGGEGIACGYFNRPELTAQRFLPDNFSAKRDRLLYRTGDLARARPDGDIEFIGRNDEQVKIRGHRIELAEIRHVLSSHPAVKQLFLMVREDVPGDKRLVAYVTVKSGSVAGGIQDSLRQHVAALLPSEMVPAAFVVLDSIPLNINGKIDRQVLPPPSFRPEVAATYQEPQTDLERKLALIWQELLGVEEVGLNDSFFDLGGHSLLAARLVARVERELGVNMPVATLFEGPTIAQLAGRLQRRSYERSWSPLVELFVPEQPSNLEPLFCVHSLGANLVSLHEIANLMAGDRAIYGLQPHGLDGMQRPFESIESIASAYIDEIRRKRPHGPYVVGGVCLGGVIAYEVAQQLRACGEAVSLVLLIDSYVPGKCRYLLSRSTVNEYLDRHLGDILALPGLARIRYVAQWLTNGLIRFGRAFGLQDRSSLAKATRSVSKAHLRAFANYKPKPYAGRVVQMMCGEASHRSYEDRRLAWSLLATSGFEVRLVPGNHHTMIEGRHARILAQELRSCLDRMQGNQATVQPQADREHPETDVCTGAGFAGAPVRL